MNEKPSRFTKSERKNINIRMALCGPTGSGKTYTALGIGTEIAKAMGGRVVVIDTERSSSDRYADKFDFDACQLGSFSPEEYMEAINEAADAGYPVLIIDSLSHAWDGQDGLLERVDLIASRSTSKNSFNAWGQATPIQRRMVDAILNYPGHVIVTMRSKMEYVQDKDSNGKTSIRKVGLSPVQRQGIEYEFDLVGDMDQEHFLIMSKSRAADLADKVLPKPGKKFALDVLAWARGTGSATVPAVVPPVTPENPPADSASQPAGSAAKSSTPAGKSKGKNSPSTSTTAPSATQSPSQAGNADKGPSCACGTPVAVGRISCAKCEEKAIHESMKADAAKPKTLRFFSCTGCFFTHSSDGEMKKCVKCNSGAVLESKTFAEANTKSDAMLAESIARKNKEMEAAKNGTKPMPQTATPPDQTVPPVPATNLASVGANVAAELTRITELVKLVTGAKTRGEILEQASHLIGRKLTGFAQLTDAEERAVLMDDLETASNMDEGARIDWLVHLRDTKLAEAGAAQ
jgi:hypothetical protein